MLNIWASGFIHSMLLVLGWTMIPPICLLAVSTAWVIVSPVPADPWRDVTIPPNGEYVRASDGEELFLRGWVPPDGLVKAVVLGVPGLGQHGGYHQPMGEALQKEGIAYFTLDWRGNGLTRTPHGDIPSQQRVYADITEVVGHFKSRFPTSRVFVLGHSLGAALIMSWAAQTQPSVDGLLVLAPAMTATAAPVPWTNWIKGPAAWLLMRHRATLLVGDTAYDRERLRQIVDWEENVEYIANDPLHLQAMSMTFALFANDVRQNTIDRAPQICVPTMVLVGDQDPAKVGAQEMYHALSVADKTWILIPQAKHMLFQIRETTEVIRAVGDWITKHK